jgi:DNA-binding MurR/RpiR family transcriptional regulator
MAQRVAQALPTLTQSHRQMADYVLAHPLKVSAMSTDELAATLGVSVATANRFARALGFQGYAQFRAALVLGFEATLAPVERLRSELDRPAEAVDVFSGVLADMARDIDTLRQRLDARGCEQAVAAILKARRIYIVGYGNSGWLGGLLHHFLEPYCENVQLLASVEGPSSGARRLSRVTPADLVIALAFPRYLSDTVRLVRSAREAGAAVLALTDRPSSPLAPLATVALYAQSDSPYFASSETIALALIEALCSAVVHATKDSLRASADLAEAVSPWLADPLRPRGGAEPSAAPAKKPPRGRK